MLIATFNWNLATCRALLSAVLVVVCLTVSATADEPLAPPPPEPVADQILLISTRTAGTSCNPLVLERELVCRRLAINSAGQPTWRSYDWHNLFKPQARQTQTVIYVHGNRVALGADAYEGLAVYDSLLTTKPPHEPVRFIIWSWPSSQIPGPIKDYQVKASRTNAVAWQLAWFLDQTPCDTPLALIGYSYGARVISGTLHLLAGGRLDRLALPRLVHPERPPARVALMAAAFDADWLLPGEIHDRALSKMDDLVVVTNHLDPAMRFFHFSTRHSRADALGLAGIPHAEKLGPALRRVHYVDVTNQVGRSHVIFDYLAARPKMERLWQELLNLPTTEQVGVLPAYAHLHTSALR